MEDLVENLTNGNVTEVKVILATVALSLAIAWPEQREELRKRD